MEDKIIITKKELDGSYIGWTIFGILWFLGIVLKSFSSESIEFMFIYGPACVFVLCIAAYKYFNRYKEIELLKLNYYNFTFYKQGQGYKSYSTASIERFEEISGKTNAVKIVLKNGTDSNDIITLEKINNKAFAQKANALLRKYDENRNNSSEYSNIIRSIDFFHRLDYGEEIYLMFLGKGSILMNNDMGKYLLKTNTRYVFLTKGYEPVYITAKGVDISSDELCDNKFFTVKRNSGSKIIFTEAKPTFFDPIKVNEVKLEIERNQNLVYSSESIKKELVIEKKLSKSYKLLFIDIVSAFIVPEIVAMVINTDYPDNKIVWGVLLGMTLGGFILEMLYINYLRKRAIREFEEGEL